MMQFSKQEREALCETLKSYMAEELDCELGQFEADFLLDFISNNLGAYFYNRGLYDAQTVLSGRIDELNDAILALEKTPGR